VLFGRQDYEGFHIGFKMTLSAALVGFFPNTDGQGVNLGGVNK